MSDQRKKWIVLSGIVGLLFHSLAAEVLFTADYEKNLRSIVNGTEVAPVGGNGSIVDLDGQKCLRAWGDGFRILRYSGSNILPGKTGAVELDYNPRLTTKEQETGQRVFGVFFSVKAGGDKNFAGFSIGANANGGKVFLYVIVKGEEDVQIYRQVDMPDGKWHKITAAWNEATLSLYLNEKLVGEAKRPKSLFADVPISIGGSGGHVAEGYLKNVKIYKQSPLVSSTDNITFEFPEKKGNASLFRHTSITTTDSRLALVLQSDQPVNLKIRTAVFKIEPNQGYAVNFSGCPQGFHTADADGILTIPLLANYSYNTVVIVPADVTNLLAEAKWEGRVDHGPQATLEWGHEGNMSSANGGTQTKKAGIFSRDTTVSRSGRPSLKLEKLTRDGEVRYQSSPVALTPDGEYLLSGYYHLAKPEFGAAAIFRAIVRRKDGTSQIISQDFLNPLIAPLLGSRWRYTYLRFKAPADAVDVVVYLCLRGSPGQQIWWDELSLRPAPPASANITQELSGQDIDPILTIEQVREYWKNREPVNVEVVNSSGMPVLHVDGKAIPSIAYNSYVVATPQSEIKPMSNAGIRWYFVRIHANAAKWWLGENKYDFKEIQNSIEAALRHDINAAIMLSVTISPRYYEWGEKNPDAIWRDHDGDKIAGYKRSIRKREKLDSEDDFWAHSYSAEGFRESVATALRDLVAHLKTFDTGKAVAGMTLLCGTDNQWFPHVGYKGFDFSIGAQKDFRRYLRDIYNDDVKLLQRSWQKENVNFENAELASFDLRNRDNVWFLDIKNGTDRRIFDSNRYNDIGVAKTADYLGNVAKEAFGRNVFVNIYAPDIIQGYSGRSARRLIFEGKGIDGVVGVPEYGNWRQPGRTGTVAVTAASAALHGKIFFSELDYRTHTSWIGPDAFHYMYYAHGGVLNEQEFAGQARRDIGALLAQGQGAWFLAMNRLLFHTAGYRSVIGELTTAAKMAADQPMPEHRGQMAVFIDEDTRNAAAYPYGPGLNQLSIGSGKIPLWRSGVAWDSYYLSDLDNPRRPRYKVNYFAVAPTIGREQIKYIRENLQKDGNVLVFSNAAGMVSESGTFENNIRELAGINVKYDPGKTGVFRIRPIPTNDPISKGLKDNVMTEMLQPLFHVEDNGAVGFGKITGTDKVGWAVKRFDDWTSVYIALPGAITPELVRNIVKEAGIEPIGPCNDMTTSGNGFITIHAIGDGEKTLQWNDKCDLIDLASGEIIKNINVLSLQMKAGETRWFRKRN